MKICRNNLRPLHRQTAMQINLLYEHDEEHEKHDGYEEHDDDQDEANVITNYALNIITTNLRSPAQSTGSPTMYQSLLSQH